MKILCLYNNDCALELFRWMRNRGHDTVLLSERPDPQWCIRQQFELTVSYTCRYILTDEVLDSLGRNAVNLHISYLPWNRGADPNIWSIMEGTPRGVTLHYMDAQTDHGDIITQQILPPAKDTDTLRTTYQELDETARNMFKHAFCYYPCWRDMCRKAAGGGSYHSAAQGRRIREMLDSYDLTVHDFLERFRLMDAE